MRLSAEKRRTLQAVADYEERYHRPMWAGRDGTKEDTCNALVEAGLLYRHRDEHHLRWWYSLTELGKRELEESRAA